MKSINLKNITSINEIVLEGQVYAIRLYYNLPSERWAMDIENNTTGEISNGIFVNTGEDILSSSGHLGLQALVPIAFPGVEKPATLDDFLNAVVLIYMTLDEYNNYRYGGQAIMRLLWP